MKACDSLCIQHQLFVGNVATMFTRQYILCGFALDSDVLRAHCEMEAGGSYEIACQPSRSNKTERSLTRETLLLYSIYCFDTTG